MANKFNIVAELQLRGPTNIKQVTQKIKSDLKSVDVKLNLTVSKALASKLKRDIQRLLGNVKVNVNLQLPKNAKQQLQQNAQALANVSSNATSANQSLAKVASSTSKASSAAKQSAQNMQQAANSAQAFGKQSALAVKRFAAFTVAAGTMAALVGAMKTGVAAAVSFEREMIKVSQVTGKSMDSLKALTREITGLSTALGASSEELVNVSRILAQTGLRANEVKVALKTLALSSLAPTFKDMTNTAEGAIAIMRQFGVTADQLGGKLGSINALAGQFAVESQDMIFAIRRAGGAFKAAGGSLEELLALFTSVRATTRESAETIATGFRTIFTRMQRPKTIEFLKEAGIELQNLEGNFIGPYEAVKRLNAGLKNLESTDPRFQQIIEELGGFRQVSKVIPLIQQFATAQRALGVAQQGTGSLAKDAATAQQSLAVQVLKVREQFLALFRDIAGSSTFQVFSKTALNLASSFIKMGDAIKPILPLIGAFAAFQGIRMGAGFLSGFAGGLKGGQGGAKGVGSNIAGNLTGKTQAVTATKQVSALTSNTQALLKLNTAVISLSSTLTRMAAASSLGSRPFSKGRPKFGPGFATGGMVPGVGNGDTVPAMLEPGEFVIRRSSVDKYGAQNLARMNRGGDVSRSRRFGPGAQSYADRRSQRFGKRMRGGEGKAYVFDFDDTLAESDAVVHEGADDPFTEFRGAKGASFVRSAKATKISSMARRRASRGHDIHVLTARPGDRSTRSSIGQFMRGIGAPAKSVIGVGGMPGPGGTASKKASVLKRLKAQYGSITFLDDDMENILAAGKVKGVRAIQAKKAMGGRIQRFKNGTGKRGAAVKKTSGEKKYGPINLGTINAKDSPGAFILLPENTQDSKFTVKDKEFKITNSGTDNNKAIKRFLSKTGMDTSKGQGRFMLKGQQHLPRFKGIFKGGTFPAMYPGRDDLEKSAYQNIIKNETSKGLGDMGQNIAKQVGVDLPGIGLDASDSFIKKDMARIKSDKGLLESVQGYAFESMIGGVTGASIGGQGAAFDVPNVSTADPKRLNAIFGAKASGLSRAEVKRNIEGVKKDAAFTRKLKNQFVSDLGSRGFDGSRYGGGTASAKKFAKGGSASDTVPALLTPGEFVFNKAASKRIGYNTLNSLNKGQAKGYAGGGPVGPGYDGGKSSPIKGTPISFDPSSIQPDDIDFDMYSKLWGKELDALTKIGGNFLMDGVEDFQAYNKRMQRYIETNLQKQRKQLQENEDKWGVGQSKPGSAQPEPGHFVDSGSGAAQSLTNPQYTPAQEESRRLNQDEPEGPASLIPTNHPAHAQNKGVTSLNQPPATGGGTTKSPVPVKVVGGTTMGAPGSIPGQTTVSPPSENIGAFGGNRRQQYSPPKKIKGVDTGMQHGPKEAPKTEARDGSNMMMMAMAAPAMIDSLANSVGMGGEAMSAFTGAATTGVMTFTMVNEAMSQLSKIPGPIGKAFASVSKAAKMTAAGIAVAGMIAKGFGDHMKQSGLEAMENAESESAAQAGAGKVRTGGVMSGVGGGAAMGAQLGMVLGPKGALAGAIIGAVAGGFKGLIDAESVIAKAITKGRQTRFMQSMDSTLKKIEKQGKVTRSQSVNLASQFGDTMDNLYQAADSGQLKEFKDQAKQMIPGLEGYINKAMEGSGSVAEAAAKMGPSFMEIVNHLSRLKGIPINDLLKELNETAELQKKVRDAEKAKEDAADSTRSLVQETNNLRDAFSEAGRQISEIGKRSSAGMATAMGQSIDPTLGGAFGTGVLGASAAGERVDLTQLENAIAQVAPNEGVAEAALDIGKLTNLLPGILEQAASSAGYGADDDKFATAVKAEMEAAGIDTEKGAGASIMAGIKAELAKTTGKGEGGLIGQAQEDPGKLAAQLMKDATPALLNALQQVGDAIVKSQQALLGILNNRNKLEHELTKQRLTTFDAQAGMDSFKDSITPDYEKGSAKSRMQKIQDRDLNRQKVILGGGPGATGTGDVSGLAGNIPAMQNFLQTTNAAIDAKRSEIENMEAAGDASKAHQEQLLAANKELKGMELQSQRVRAALEDAAAGGKTLGELQSLLSDISRTRQFLAGQITSQVTFGTDESRQKFSDTTTAAQALASGDATMEDIPEEMRGAVLSFLQGLGTGGQGMLSGKSGAQVIQEQNESMLREEYADELATGDMSEADFQELVAATFEASKTEKMLQQAILDKMGDQVRASQALETILMNQLVVQDDLVREAVEKGSQAIVDALNAVELERAKSEALKAEKEADKKVKRGEKAEKAEELFGTEEGMSLVEDEKENIQSLQKRRDDAVENAENVMDMRPEGQGRQDFMAEVDELLTSDIGGAGQNEKKQGKLIEMMKKNESLKDLSDEQLLEMAQEIMYGSMLDPADYQRRSSPGSKGTSSRTSNVLDSAGFGSNTFEGAQTYDAEQQLEDVAKEQKRLYDEMIAAGVPEETANRLIYGTKEEVSDTTGSTISLKGDETFGSVQETGVTAKADVKKSTDKVTSITERQDTVKEERAADNSNAKRAAEDKRAKAAENYKKMQECHAKKGKWDSATATCTPPPPDPFASKAPPPTTVASTGNQNQSPVRLGSSMCEDGLVEGPNGTCITPIEAVLNKDKAPPGADGLSVMSERHAPSTRGRTKPPESAGGLKQGTQGYDRARDKAEAESGAKKEEQQQAFVTALTEFTGAIQSAESPLTTSLNSFIEAFGGEDGLKMTLRMPDGVNVNVTGLKSLEGPVQQAVIQDIGNRLAKLEGVVTGDQPAG